MKYYGIGIKTLTTSNNCLDARYIKISTKKIQYNSSSIVRVPDFLPIKKEVFSISTDISKPIASIEDAYFRLYLLSTKKQKPNTINLNNIFSILPTNAWTNFGPLKPENIEPLQLKGVPIIVQNVDKFPFLTNYIIPKDVRIASSSSVRLGAYLSKGTVVMPSGFVNYNAGTLGKSMVEGRISQGVTVGDGSDIGGGASIMGTLSGGGKNIIKIGKNCLIGANAGTGISLGNNCTIEAGLYITSGTKILYNKKIAKGIDLSGKSNILYIRDSVNGNVKAIIKKNTTTLNSELH